MVERQPNKAELLFGRGNLEFWMEDYAAAERDYQQCLLTFPYSVKVLEALAYAKLANN